MADLQLLLAVLLIYRVSADPSYVDFLCADPKCSAEISRGTLHTSMQLSKHHIEKNTTLVICGKSITNGTSLLRVSSDGMYYFIDASFVTQSKEVDLRQLRRFPISHSVIQSRLLSPAAKLRSISEKPETEVPAQSVNSTDSITPATGTEEAETDHSKPSVVYSTLDNKTDLIEQDHTDDKEALYSTSNDTNETNNTPVSDVSVVNKSVITGNRVDTEASRSHDEVVGRSDDLLSDSGIKHTSHELETEALSGNESLNDTSNMESAESKSLIESESKHSQSPTATKTHLSDGNASLGVETANALPSQGVDEFNETMNLSSDKTVSPESSQPSVSLNNDTLEIAHSGFDTTSVSPSVIDTNHISESSETDKHPSFPNVTSDVSSDAASTNIEEHILANTKFDVSDANTTVHTEGIDAPQDLSNASPVPDSDGNVATPTSDLTSSRDLVGADVDFRLKPSNADALVKIPVTTEEANTTANPTTVTLVERKEGHLHNLKIEQFDPTSSAPLTKHPVDENELIEQSKNQLNSSSSQAYRWTFVCTNSVTNVTSPQYIVTFDIPSFICRLLLDITRYFSFSSAKLVSLFPPRSRSSLDTVLNVHFSSSLNLLTCWILFVSHLFFIWFIYKTFMPSVFKATSPALSLHSDLVLTEHVLQLGSCLTEQEQANSLLVDRVAQLTRKLRQKEQEWDIGIVESSTKLSNLETELHTLQTKLHDTQCMLSDKEKSYDSVVETFDEKLKSTELKLVCLEKEKHELEASWQAKTKELVEVHQKAMDDSKADRDELYGQAVNYYKRMESLQAEIDRLHEVCQQTEQKLASTEAELSSLQTVFTNLKSFDHLIDHLNSPESQISSVDGEDELNVAPSVEDEDENHNENEECNSEIIQDAPATRLKAYLSQFANLGRLQAELNAAKSQIQLEEAKVTSERELREQLETKLQSIERETDVIRSECHELQEEKSALQTKLDVLSNYFKERECELQRDLGKHLIVGSESSEALNIARKRNRELEAELKSLREQLSAARRDLAETEKIGRRQLAELDKRSHENWLAARAADHQLRELRSENASLRQRLIGVPSMNVTARPHLPTSVRLNQVIHAPAMFRPDVMGTVNSDKRSLSGQSLNSSSSIPPFPHPNTFSLPRGHPSNTSVLPPPPFLPDFVPPPLRFPPCFPGLPPPPFTPHFNRGVVSGNQSNHSSVKGDQ